MSSPSSRGWASQPSAALLRLELHDPSAVVRAFALYSLLFRVAGASLAVASGLPRLALVQVLGALGYSLFLRRRAAERTWAFLGLLGPEWLLWGVAVVITVGGRPLFHLHSVLVTAGVLLLLHDLPLRLRILLFLLPLVVPAPFLLVLQMPVPQVELPALTATWWRFANQLLGIAFLGAVSVKAMLDHARARHVAEQHAEAQTRLVEDLSHELRTPIATILTAAQGARASPDIPLPVADYLEWIEESARAGARLVERMLELAAFDRGHRHETEPEALGVAVRAAVDRLRPAAKARSIDFCFRAEAEPEQTVDAVSLEIVLQALLTNALEHSPAGSSVEIRLSAPRGAARVEVEDRGDGIAPEDLPHVFRRMWRGDRARSRDRGHFGLGLAIAQRHAALLGATLEVRSQLDRGSVFSLVFRGEGGRIEGRGAGAIAPGAVVQTDET